MNRRGKLFLIGAAAGAVLGACALWLRAQDWPRNQRLARDGAPVTAMVTSKGLNGADTVSYTFSAEGALHSGSGKPGLGTPKFEEIAVDDDILVFYLKGDPDVNVLGDPREHLRSNNRILAVAMLLAAPILFVALRSELRSH